MENMEKVIETLRGIPAADRGKFLSWYIDSATPVAEIEGEGLPSEQSVRDAFKSVFGGIDPAKTDIDDEDVGKIEAMIVKAAFAPPSPTLKPWERAQVTTVPPTATKSSKPAPPSPGDTLPPEDLRGWEESALKEEIVDLLDAAYRKESLPFSVASDESRDQIEQLLSWIGSSDEPITQEQLTSRIARKFARIKENRDAGEAVKAALNGARVGQELFGALVRLKRTAAMTVPLEEVCAAAVALDGTGHPTEEIVKVLERGIALDDLDRACRRVLGIPLPSGSGRDVEPTRTVPSKPDGRKDDKKAWDRR